MLLQCQRLGSIPGLGRSPGGGHGNPLHYSCLENPHGQRSLVDDSPWSCKESDTTEQLRTAQQNICIGYFSGWTRWLLKAPSQLELEFPFCIFHKRWFKISHWIFSTKYHALDSVMLTDYIAIVSPNFDVNVGEEMDSGGTADKSLKKRFSQDFYLFHDFSINMYSVIISREFIN